jgi:cyclase
VVVKGVQFRNHRVVGEIVELAQRYAFEGADELVFYDITASPDGRSVDRDWVSRVAAVIDIPFCVAGGIGTQCVVLGVDSREQDGDYHVYQNTGDPDKTTAAQRLTTDWIREAQERGAGEVVLNCMNRDGVRRGYDTAQLRTIRDVCSVPLIASGGAGAIEHFRDVFRIADVDGALAASVFHSAEIDICDLKSWLGDQGIAVRPRGDNRDH